METKGRRRASIDLPTISQPIERYGDDANDAKNHDGTLFQNVK
jgi:hypothetical protein